MQNLELLSASSLLLLDDALSDLGKLPFFFAEQHTFCKYMNIDTKKMKDQITVNSNYCQENRETGIRVGLKHYIIITTIK